MDSCMTISLKNMAILAGIIILAFFGFRWYYKSQMDQLLQDHKKDLQMEAERIREQRDSVIKLRDLRINELIQENEKAVQESAYWYDQAKKKNFNPNYNIDFLTSYRIISESNYKSGE